MVLSLLVPWHGGVQFCVTISEAEFGLYLCHCTVLARQSVSNAVAQRLYCMCSFSSSQSHVDFLYIDGNRQTGSDDHFQASCISYNRVIIIYY